MSHRYGVSCTCGYQAVLPRSKAGAEKLAALHRHVSHKGRDGLVQVLAICPNCGQWQRDGDCLNDCAARGFGGAK